MPQRRSAALFPILALAVIALCACSSHGQPAKAAGARPKPVASVTAKSTPVATGEACSSLGVSVADLSRVTGLTLTRVDSVKEPASTFKIVGCAFAGPYSNGDSVGITAADDSQQNAASLATSEYADLQKSHGGCVWDYAEAAFHCNPLPGAPAAAATVLVVGSQHVWNVQLWATTQTKLTVARSAIEVYLGSR